MKGKHIGLFIGVLLLDQLSKWGIASQLALHEEISVIPGFFTITYVQNTGSAWSMLEGQMLFFYIVSVLALICMLYFYRSSAKDDVLTRYGLVLMMAGTAGNFIDRILFQHVRDFLAFRIFGYDFPVFNIADTALCIGVLLILLVVCWESFGGFHKCAK